MAQELQQQCVREQLSVCRRGEGGEGLTVTEVVLPAGALSDAETSPLVLLRESLCGQVAYEWLWEDDVPVLVLVVCSEGRV